MMRRTKPPKSLFDEKCPTWPWCLCGQKWRHWQSELPRWASPSGPALTPEDTACATTDLYFMLSCVSVHCPVASFRRKACAELLQPVFAEEREAERRRGH